MSDNDWGENKSWAIRFVAFCFAGSVLFYSCGRVFESPPPDLRHDPNLRHLEQTLRSLEYRIYNLEAGRQPIEKGVP